MTATFDLLGKRFGRLVVQSRNYDRTPGKFWNCLCDCGNLSVVDTGHLNNGHSSSCGCYGQNLRRKHTLDEKYFETIDTEEKAYWLGFIFADGNIHKNKRQFSIVLKNDDIEHLNKLKSCIDSTHSLYEVSNKKYNHYIGLGFKNKFFCSHLINLGVIPRKSKVACPPTLSRELNRHFWRGVIDGDGCLYSVLNKGKKRSQWGINLVGSLNMVTKFKDFVLENGIPTTSKIRSVKISPEIYQIFISGNINMSKLYPLLYSNSSIYLDRKFQKAYGAFPW